MKAILTIIMTGALCSCAAQTTTATPPTEDKGTVHGFPAEWLQEPEKHGLPPATPTDTVKNGEPEA